MRTPRLYQNCELQCGTTLTLTKEAAHHAIHVLRLLINSKIILFNGKGGEYLATIKNMTKKSIVVNIEKYFSTELESPRHIHLAQGIIRREKMDFVIQKAVELGVSSITPILTEHCNFSLSQLKKRHTHWHAVAVNACEQCGRNKIPSIEMPQTFYDYLKNKINEKNIDKLLLSPTASKKISQLKINKAKVCVVIGPEGGFSEEEIEKAKQNEFQTIQLGPRILRSETAALATLTSLQVLFGDMG